MLINRDSAFFLEAKLLKQIKNINSLSTFERDATDICKSYSSFVLQEQQVDY
jgi:hypothetical protein